MVTGISRHLTFSFGSTTSNIKLLLQKCDYFDTFYFFFISYLFPRPDITNLEKQKKRGAASDNLCAFTFVY